MNKLPPPRPFQQYALDQLKVAGNNVLLSAPTGGGKAMLAMYIARDALASGKSVLFVVDRITLIDQLSKTANSYGLEHNLIQGNTRITKDNCNFTIASIQTFFRNENHSHNGDFSEKDTPHPLFDIVLVDEAHALYTNLTNYIKSFRGQVIGLTATPYTKGLGNVYNKAINCTTAHELTENGTLVKLNAFTFRKIDMTDAKTIGGEWSAKEVEVRSAKIYGDVVSTYLTHANGIRSICFCATVNHCHQVAEQFKQAGVSVGVFTGDTNIDNRAQLLNDFDNNKISILISVSALSKGFDRPYVGCILDMRPLRRSLAEYIQMIGRGLRSCAGKTECLLFDFTGNIDRFLPDFEDVYYNGVDSLDSSERLNRIRTDSGIKSIACPNCGNQHIHHKCTNCGYTITPKYEMTKEEYGVKLEQIKMRHKAEMDKIKSDAKQFRQPITPPTRKKSILATLFGL